MKKGATRPGDVIVCNAHGFGSMGPAGSPDVFVNGVPMGRQSDAVDCHGAKSIIVTGAALVNVNSLGASRFGEWALHPGSRVMGASSDVFIGGPSAGMLVGPLPSEAIKTCRAAADGRPNGDIQQSAGNCGVEAARQIVNRHHEPPVTESQMLRRAIQHGWADDETGNTAENDGPPKKNVMGGTSPEGREEILRSYGVESERQAPTPENIAEALSEGKGVITPHFSGPLWNDPESHGSHAVLVVGVEYDANGKVAFYRINDTGDGTCFKRVPAAQFEGSLKATKDGHVDMNVTKEKIW